VIAIMATSSCKTTRPMFTALNLLLFSPPKVKTFKNIDLSGIDFKKWNDSPFFKNKKNLDNLIINQKKIKTNYLSFKDSLLLVIPFFKKKEQEKTEQQLYKKRKEYHSKIVKSLEQCTVPEKKIEEKNKKKFLKDGIMLYELFSQALKEKSMNLPKEKGFTYIDKENTNYDVLKAYDTKYRELLSKLGGLYKKELPKVLYQGKLTTRDDFIRYNPLRTDARTYIKSVEMKSEKS